MITLNYYSKNPKGLLLSNIMDCDIESKLDELEQYLNDGVDYTFNFSSSLFLLAVRTRIKKHTSSQHYNVHIDGVVHHVNDAGRFESYPENDPFDYYLDAMLK